MLRSAFCINSKLLKRFRGAQFELGFVGKVNIKQNRFVYFKIPTTVVIFS